MHKSNIYQMVGNGTFDGMLNFQGFPVAGDYGNGFLKMNLANDQNIRTADYFASYNAADGPFDENIELGSSSPLILPSMLDGTGDGATSGSGGRQKWERFSSSI